MSTAQGPIYTKGKTYRARAEARQREYRANVLGVDHGKYGHFLTSSGAANGDNFITPGAFAAAQTRDTNGKGVGLRTFENMLSSQAMCFNIFGPLSNELELATEVLETFIPGLQEISAIHIEYTPSNDIFGDQTGFGGVDCDLLIEGQTQTGKLVQVVETKFVEKEFSICGFRKAGRAKKGQDVCPEDVPVRDDRTACLYSSNKSYQYWPRTDEFNILADGALPDAGCPFGNQRWQLWVNVALAHAEASRREATDVRFCVCSSPSNTKLLGDGEVLEEFRALLQEPDTVQLFDLEKLLARISETAPMRLADWSRGLNARYADI